MIKKAAFITLATLSTLVGIYPVIYFVIDRRFGLLESKSAALLANSTWNAAFYTHIVLGGVALLVGWTQFVARWRKRRPMLHRNIGKIYVISVLLSALTALYIALFATGGPVPATGFFCMGAFWFITTLQAYRNISKGSVVAHQKMMIYSYATCLAAVTLRIYLPVCIAIFNDFNTAYALVAWLSWVPNIVVAWFIVQKIKPEQTAPENHRQGVELAAQMLPEKQLH